MNTFKIAAALPLLYIAMLPGAHAVTFTLDFDHVDTTHGTVITDGSSSSGTPPGIAIAISALNNNGPDYAVAYNSEGNGGADPDLEQGSNGFKRGAPEDDPRKGELVKDFGNLLIIQEHAAGCASGTCDAADDDLHGGKLRFEFGQRLILEQFDYFDIDGSPNQQAETISVKLFTTLTGSSVDWANGAGVISITDIMATGGDNTFGTYVLPNDHLIYGIEFDLSSSGAIDNLVLATPIPGALPLFLSGLFGLFMVSRKRRHLTMAA